MAVSGYCLKCKSPRDIKDPQAITMKNGKPATTGTCPVCGTKIFKIGKAA
jgi:RNase P subunit RPR2